MASLGFAACLQELLSLAKLKEKIGLGAAKSTLPRPLTLKFLNLKQ